MTKLTLSIGRNKSKPGEWSEFACVGEGKVYEFCDKVGTVSNTAHVADANRIIEDGYIRSSLIWDESCLRNTRTTVSWVTPNHWPDSIYGNIRFVFNWRDIVRDKQLYWVEVMREYSPTAYRILVTNLEHSDLQQYRPESDDGPLVYLPDKDEWYANYRYNGELMIESDLNLNQCTAIEYVNHHNKICSKFSLSKTLRKCNELGRGRHIASVMFLSGVLARKPAHVIRLMLDTGNPAKLSKSTTSAINSLYDYLISLASDSAGRENSLEDSVTLVRAVLFAVASGDPRLAASLMQMVDRKSIDDAFLAILNEYFRIPIKKSEGDFEFIE